MGRVISIKFITRDLGDSEEIFIIPLSDVHIGEEGFNEKMLDGIIEKVLNTDSLYVVLIGDLINNATKSSKSDVYHERMTPHEQVNFIVEKLKPIRHKILGSVSGNHEDRTSRDSGVDLSQVIAQFLEVPYDSASIVYQLKYGTSGSGKNNHVIYTTHGFGGGGTKGAKANKLQNLGNMCIADLYIMGHYHDVITFSDSIYVPDTRHDRMILKRRQYLITGSCLEYGGYAEKMLLRPGGTGYPLVHLNKGEIKIIT